MATETAPNQAAELRALFKYRDHLARQVPVLWLPNPPFQLTLYKSNLKGPVPQGIYTEIYPHDYSLS